MRKIFVKVKTNSHINAVKQIGENEFDVMVAAPPVEGKANKAIIGLLADYFDMPKSRIDILAGHTSKNKIITIL